MNHDTQHFETEKKAIEAYRQAGDWLGECEYYAGLAKSGLATDQLMQIEGYSLNSVKNRIRLGNAAAGIRNFLSENNIRPENISCRGVLDLFPLYGSGTGDAIFYSGLRLLAEGRLPDTNSRRLYIRSSPEDHGHDYGPESDPESLKNTLEEYRKEGDWLDECRALALAAQELSPGRLTEISGYGKDALTERIRVGAVADQIRAYLGKNVSGISLSAVNDLWPLVMLSPPHQTQFYDALDLASRGVFRNRKERRQHVSGIMSSVESDTKRMDRIETDIKTILAETGTDSKGGVEKRLRKLEEALKNSGQLSADDAIERLNVRGSEFMQTLAHYSTYIHSMVSPEQDSMVRDSLENLARRLQLYVRRMYGDEFRGEEKDTREEPMPKLVGKGS